MFRKRLFPLFAVLAALLLLFSIGGKVLLEGRVVSVADGDSLDVLTSQGTTQRVRLYGIDSPEMRQSGGGEARKFARNLSLWRKIEIRVMDKDAYGRAVVIITLPDGRVLNEELVRSGHAWVYNRYCDAPECDAWRTLEKEAKAGKTGLWRQKKPVPPWIWRRENPREDSR